MRMYILEFLYDFYYDVSFVHFCIEATSNDSEYDIIICIL